VTTRGRQRPLLDGAAESVTQTVHLSLELASKQSIVHSNAKIPSRGT
jgi:hypothetical protein